MPLGDLEDLVQTALACGLIGPEARRQLMRGLPMGFVYSLPTVSRPIDQLRFDLMELERTPRLIGLDRHPMAVWLSNAADKTATEGNADAARLFARRADALHRPGAVTQRVESRLARVAEELAPMPSPEAPAPVKTPSPRPAKAERAYVLTLDTGVDGWKTADPPIDPIELYPVTLPTGDWARSDRPHTAPWREVRDGIDAEITRLAEVIQPEDCIAVFMRGVPPAMAMLLGSRLRQRRFADAAVRYFERVRVRGRSAWHNRGPHWLEPTEPVEETVLMPRFEGPSEKSREAAVILQIDGRVPMESVDRALAGLRVDTRLVLTHRSPRRGGLTAPAEIERALADLVEGIDRMRARAPRLRNLHISYRGPAALAARVADDLLECDLPATAYAEQGDDFVPAVELSRDARATLFSPPAPEDVPSNGFDVFLAYARADEAIATALYGTLRDRGLRVFLDESSLLPGDTWDTAIPDALARSALVVALVSPMKDGLADAWYQREELIAAIRQTRQAPGTRRLVPILLDGLQRDALPYGLGRLTTIGPLRGTPEAIAAQAARELAPVLPARSA